jgi:hypothetical protein
VPAPAPGAAVAVSRGAATAAAVAGPNARPWVLGSRCVLLPDGPRAARGHSGQNPADRCHQPQGGAESLYGTLELSQRGAWDRLMWPGLMGGPAWWAQECAAESPKIGGALDRVLNPDDRVDTTLTRHHQCHPESAARQVAETDLCHSLNEKWAIAGRAGRLSCGNRAKFGQRGVSRRQAALAPDRQRRHGGPPATGAGDPPPDAPPQVSKAADPLRRASQVS